MITNRPIDICYRFGLDKDDCARFISTLSLEGTPLNSACPSSRHKGCNSLAKYRNIDGSCNNVQNPSWGSAMTAYTRILFPQYFDGKGVSYRVTISKERKRKKEKKKFKEKWLVYHISLQSSPVLAKIREKISTVCSNHYYLASRWAHFGFFYLSLVTRNAIRVVSCVLTLGLTESDFRTDERNGNKREEEYIEIHSNPLCRVPWCCRYLCGIIIVQLFAASERLALPSSPFLTYPSPHSSCRLNFFFFRCTRCTLTNAISSRREWLHFFSFLTYDSERPMIQGYFPSRLSDYMRFSCGEKRFVCIYILTLMGYRMCLIRFLCRGDVFRARVPRLTISVHFLVPISEYWEEWDNFLVVVLLIHARGVLEIC